MGVPPSAQTDRARASGWNTLPSASADYSAGSTTVLLRSSDGGEARLSDFVTDLPAVAMLDANGVLEFSFGARLTSQGAYGGAFRGRISIRVDYY